jgi:cystine transport system substrate-binding protein
VAAETEDPSLSALVFRKGSDDLVAAVDQALADLRADGTLAAISDEYFGADVTQ